MIRAKQSISHCQRWLKRRSFSSLTIRRVPDDMLRQLLDHLKDMPQATSNMMANTIQTAIMKHTQAEFYVDGWPKITSIVCRITSATVTDIALYTSSKSKAVELLHDDHILKSMGSHKKGGVIFADMEDSLAEYLMEHIRSSDGKPLLKSMYSGTMLQLPKEKAKSFSESKFVSLPEDYSIGILKPRDGKYLRHVWNETLKNHTRDEQQFEHMICTLPTSAVFHNDDPTHPVGWMLAYPCGRIGHAFVEKSHRGKKLFPILATHLCKKILQVGIIPEVVTTHENVIKTASEGGFVKCGKYIRLYVDRACYRNT